MSEVRVERVVSRKDRKKFIMFPWKVYKGDENWTPPLISDVKEKINKRKNPFFEHAEMELFLAYKGGKIQGRVAAIVDENHNKAHNERVVFFGLYESSNDLDVAKGLLNKIMEWGKERNMEKLRGPVNLSMNDECAFLLEGFDSPSVLLMPYNPSYYLDLMEECGLTKAKDLYAFFMARDHKTTKKVDEIVDKVKKTTQITVRPMDMKNFAEEIEKIKCIYNCGWEKNWGFVSWTDKEMHYMAHKLQKILDPDLVIIAEDRGKPVGFALGLPNYNEILIKLNGRLFPFGIFKLFLDKRKIKGVRAAVFGVLKEYRMSGVSYMLYSEFERNCVAKGYEWAETSWQLEDNVAINRFVQSVGGKIYKKYRIYEQAMN